MRRGMTAVLVAATVFVSCGDDPPRAVESRTDGTDGSVDTSVPADTAAATTTSTSSSTTTPETTVASTTTAAPTTTEAPLTAADLVLRSNGIGPFDFGADAATVSASLAAVLGAPTGQIDAHFPVAADGHHEDLDGNTFATEFARFTCFANDLCVAFGGVDPAALTFAGWNYGSGPEPAMPAPVLSTADAVHPGALWADVAGVIEVYEHGCYSEGYGTTAGIDLHLLSPDAWFGSMGVMDTVLPVVPNPATVVITYLAAGEQTYSVEGDC